MTGQLLVTPAELGVYLNDQDSLNEDRASLMIRYAQDRCEQVLNPLPPAAAGIVMRVAHRGYVGVKSGRQEQLDYVDAAYGSQDAPIGGIYLTAQDRQDLLECEEGSEAQQAFTIRLKSPAALDYCAGWPPVPWSRW